jgi:hypothetical protein
MPQRILQNTGADLDVAVTVNGTGTDPSPDTATVTIRRADGTTLVNAAAATNGLNGGFTYPLSSTNTALLDTLTASWTFTLGGATQTLTTQAEIVGGYHFALPSLQALAPLNDTQAYPVAKLVEARTLAEQLIETECGRAFVPRYWYGRVDGYRWPFADVRTVRSAVNTDGTVLTGTSLTDVYNGHFGAYYGYRRRNQSWTVGLEHGMDSAPLDVSRASMLLARSILVANKAGTTGSIDERATTVSYADAGLTYSLTTAGARGAATNLGEVNATIDRYRLVAIA